MSNTPPTTTPPRRFDDAPTAFPSSRRRVVARSAPAGRSAFPSSLGGPTASSGRGISQKMTPPAPRDEGGGQSAFDKIFGGFGEVVSALPGGLAGLGNAAYDSTLGSASALVGQLIAPDVSAQDLRDADGWQAAVLRAITNEDLMEKFEADRRGEDVGFGEMWAEAVPILSDTAASMRDSGGRLVDQVAALAPGGKPAGEGAYAQAWQDGTLVPLLFEDVGNVALAGRMTTGLASNAARAGAARRAGASSRVIRENALRGRMASTPYEPTGRFGQGAVRANRRFTDLDDALGRAIFAPYRGAARLPGVFTRYLTGEGSPLEFGARIRSGTGLRDTVRGSQRYQDWRNNSRLGRLWDASGMSGRLRDAREAQADVDAETATAYQVLMDAVRKDSGDVSDQVAAAFARSGMARSMFGDPELVVRRVDELGMDLTDFAQEYLEWDLGRGVDGGSRFHEFIKSFGDQEDATRAAAEAVAKSLRFLDGSLDEATAARVQRSVDAWGDVGEMLSDRFGEGYGRLDPAAPAHLQALMGDELLPYNEARVLQEAERERARLERRQERLGRQVERRLGRLDMTDEMAGGGRRAWREEAARHSLAARSVVDDLGVREVAAELWANADNELPSKYANMGANRLRTEVLDTVAGEIQARLRAGDAVQDWLSPYLDGLSALPVDDVRMGRQRMRADQARAAVADQAARDADVARARERVETDAADRAVLRMEDAVRNERFGGRLADEVRSIGRGESRTAQKVRNAAKAATRLKDSLLRGETSRAVLQQQIGEFREGFRPVLEAEVYDARGAIDAYMDGRIRLDPGSELGAQFLAETGLSAREALQLRLDGNRRIFGGKDSGAADWDQAQMWLEAQGRLPDTSTLDDVVSALAQDVSRLHEAQQVLRIIEGRTVKRPLGSAAAEWEATDKALRAERAKLDERLVREEARSDWTPAKGRAWKADDRAWQDRWAAHRAERFEYVGGSRQVKAGLWDDKLRPWADLLGDPEMGAAAFDAFDPIQAMRDLAEQRHAAEWVSQAEKAAAAVQDVLARADQEYGRTGEVVDGPISRAVDAPDSMAEADATAPAPRERAPDHGSGLQSWIDEQRDEWAALHSTTDAEYYALRAEFDRVRMEHQAEIDLLNAGRRASEAVARGRGASAERGARAGRQAGRAEGRAAELARQRANMESRARSSVDAWESERKVWADQTQRAHAAGVREGAARAGLEPLIRELETVEKALADLDAGLADRVEAARLEITSAPARYRLAVQAGQGMSEFISDALPLLHPDDVGTRQMLMAMQGDLVADAVAAVDTLESPQYVPGGTLERQTRGATKPPLKRRTSEEFLKEGVIPRMDAGAQATLVARRIEAQARNEVSSRILAKYGRNAAEFLEGVEGWEDLGGRDLLAEVNARSGGVEYVPVHPTSPTVRLDSVDAESVLMPKFVLDMVDRETRPAGAAELAAQSIIDVPTRLWKNTVLALRTGWHMGNVIGNMLMAWAGGTDPARMLELWRETWQMTRDESGPMRLRSSGPTTEQRMFIRDIGDIVGNDGVMSERVFRNLGVRENRLQRRLLGDMDRQGSRGARVLDALVHPIRSSYNMNQFVDDFTHNLVYLDQIGKGMTEQQALAHSLKVAGDFNKMTKFERSVLRRAMPFYAWMKHITQLTWKLATENPLRAIWTMHLWTLFADDDQDWYGDLGFGRLPYRGSDSEFVNVGNLMPFGSAFEIAGNPIDTVISSANPLLKLGVYGATGMEMGMDGLQPGSRAFWEQQVTPYGSEGYGPPGWRALLEQTVNSIPQARLLRDLNRPRVARYDTGTPVLRGGRTIPNENLQSTQQAVLRDLLGVPLPRQFRPLEIRKRREDAIAMRDRARPGG